MKRLPAIIASATWMGLIFFASSLPGSATGPDTPAWTVVLKLLHFANFGILALLLLAVLRGNRKPAEIRPLLYLLILLLTVLYAMSDEYHQRFSPGRHASARDVLIDTLGASAFLGASFMLQKRKQKRKNGLMRAKGAPGESRDLQSTAPARGKCD